MKQIVKELHKMNGASFAPTALTVVQTEPPTKPCIAGGWFTDAEQVKAVKTMAKSDDKEMADFALQKLAEVETLKAEHKKEEAMLKDIIRCRVTLEKAKQFMEESQRKYGEWKQKLIDEADEYAPKFLHYEKIQKAAKKRKAEEEEEGTSTPTKKPKSNSRTPDELGTSPPKSLSAIATPAV